MHVAVYRWAATILTIVPLRLSYRLARVVGSVMSLIPNSRRAAVRENLAVVYGVTPSDPRIRTDVRRALQHSMLNYVDLFSLGKKSAVQRIRAIPAPSTRLLDEALAEGKGVILISAHLGNFDTVVHKLAIRGDRVLIPVEPISPPELLEFFTRQRATLGTTIVPIGPDTFKQMAAHLRLGGIVVIVCDRDVQGSGHVVPFFGRDVSLPNAPILLALRTGAPIFGAFGYRHANNSISAHLTPTILRVTGRPGLRLSVREEIDRGMRAVAQILESEIRQDPGQWVAQQRVFLQMASASASAAHSMPEALRPLAVSGVGEGLQ